MELRRWKCVSPISFHESRSERFDRRKRKMICTRTRRVPQESVLQESSVCEAKEGECLSCR